MNFQFDINSIIPYEITKFNSDLRIIHPRNITEDEAASQLNRDMRQKLAVVIDKMGEASSKAQGLREIITSYRKFSLNDQHRIYLMKDQFANNGNGTVVAMLKVGEKKLFIYDYQGKNHEMSPTCVLDFYVNEYEQRKGYGRKIFDFMLEMENVRPQHLAIDSPSEKSMKFLKKHYNLINPIPQTNSFTVFGGFFENRPELYKRNSRYSASNQTPTGLFTRTDLPPINNGLRNNDYGRVGSVDSKYSRNENSYSNLQRNNSYTGLASNMQSNFQNNTFKEDLLGTQISKFSSHSAHANLSSKQADHMSPTSSNYFDSYNQNRSLTTYSANTSNNNVINYYGSQFNQNKFSPFPSLNSNNSRNGTVLSRPPLPPSTTNQYLKKEETFSPSAVTYHDRNLILSNNKNDIYNPFPSLASYKSSPSLFTNDSYMSSKFRKTKLWN